MGSSDDFVLMLDEATAGRGDAADDPYVRKLLQARRRSGGDDVVSIKDLAPELGVSVRTLRRRNNRTDAPPRVKRGRRLMYRRADIAAWLASGSTRPGIPADGGSQ